MRAFALVLALAVALALTYGGYQLATAVTASRARRSRRRARWRVIHHGQQGQTVIAVNLMLPDGRVVDSHVVARLDDSCPDWTERFLLAKELAEERAFHLNSGEEPPP